MSLKIPPEDGIGNYVYNLSQKLIEKGHQVTVITRGNHNSTKMEKYDDINLYQVTFLPVYPVHVNLHGVFVRQLLKSKGYQFDVIHFHTPLPPAIKTTIPTITTFHTTMKAAARNLKYSNSPISLANKLQSNFSYLTEKKLLKISDKVTTVASSVSEELSEYGIRSTDAEVIGNGVNENLFQPIKSKRNKRYLLYAGRLSYEKGIFDFLECAKMICGRYEDIDIKLVGKGPLFNELFRAVSTSEFKERFEFFGYVDKSRLIDIYQNATIFVQPSYYEGLPTTLLEAMSCGIPVVATSISGNIDIIKSGYNGLLIPTKSPIKMVDAISLLLENGNLRGELGKNARKTVEKDFTWDIISNKIVRCYETMIRK